MKIATLIERLARILHNDAQAHGLKPAHWEALRYLARANRFSRSPGALTTYLGVTKGTVSQTVQVLERKGLLRKTIAQGDKRGIKLDLTTAGIALLKDDPATALNAAIKAMPAPDRHALGNSLESLVKDMIASRGGRPFGACQTCRHFAAKHEQGKPHFCTLLDEPLSEDDGEKICVEQDPDPAKFVLLAAQ